MLWPPVTTLCAPTTWALLSGLPTSSVFRWCGRRSRRAPQHRTPTVCWRTQRRRSRTTSSFSSRSACGSLRRCSTTQRHSACSTSTPSSRRHCSLGWCEHRRSLTNSSRSWTTTTNQRQELEQLGLPTTWPRSKLTRDRSCTRWQTTCSVCTKWFRGIYTLKLLIHRLRWRCSSTWWTRCTKLSLSCSISMNITRL